MSARGLTATGERLSGEAVPTPLISRNPHTRLPPTSMAITHVPHGYASAISPATRYVGFAPATWLMLVASIAKFVGAYSDQITLPAALYRARCRFVIPSRPTSMYLPAPKLATACRVVD